MRAQLLEARRDDRTAVELLNDPLLDHDLPMPSSVLWALLRGRVHERLGRRDEAVEAYSLVTAAWQHADPELQPYVAEAKAALGRLAGEVRN